MKQTQLYIRGMCSNRCIETVTQLLGEGNYKPMKATLGEIIHANGPIQKELEVLNRKLAMVIDLAKCDSCGKCTKACNKIQSGTERKVKVIDPARKTLISFPGNFTCGETLGQSDGVLFWKIYEGRKPMPSLKKKLNETQISQPVIYMTTLKQ